MMNILFAYIIRIRFFINIHSKASVLKYICMIELESINFPPCDFGLEYSKLSLYLDDSLMGIFI